MILKSAMVVILSTLVITPAIADTVELTARPTKCIALRKGQICYQSIELRWQTALPGNYCLWVVDNSEPLQCWKATDRGTVQYEFAAKKNVRFQLRAETGKEPVASTDVVVAWVYKSRTAGRPRWRLF